MPVRPSNGFLHHSPKPLPIPEIRLGREELGRVLSGSSPDLFIIRSWGLQPIPPLSCIVLFLASHPSNLSPWLIIKRWIRRREESDIGGSHLS